MESKFTIYFDDPFWVGVYEKQDESGYRVARVVFGSEPTEAELYQFILEKYSQFDFSLPTKLPPQPQRPKNFKRVQREVRQAMQVEGLGTKAQEALKLALTQNKQERRQKTRQERQRSSEADFQRRQEKKQEKHRGH